MARVTVEDCLKNVKNRFELVIVAAKRARQLMRGKDAKVEWDNDKSTVVALREIAAGYTNFEHDTHEDDHKVNAQPATIAKHEDKAEDDEEIVEEHSETIVVEHTENNDHHEERDEE